MIESVSAQRAICPSCGKEVAVGIPRAGDGSVDVFRRHKTATGEHCFSSRQRVEPEDYVPQKAGEGRG